MSIQNHLKKISPQKLADLAEVITVSAMEKIALITDEDQTFTKMANLKTDTAGGGAWWFVFCVLDEYMLKAESTVQVRYNIDYFSSKLLVEFSRTKFTTLCQVAKDRICFVEHKLEQLSLSQTSQCN